MASPSLHSIVSSGPKGAPFDQSSAQVAQCCPPPARSVPAGSIPHMRLWTFDAGIASFEARRLRYGRHPESPPLSPKSMLVQMMGPPAAAAAASSSTAVSGRATPAPPLQVLDEHNAQGEPARGGAKRLVPREATTTPPPAYTAHDRGLAAAAATAAADDKHYHRHHHHAAAERLTKAKEPSFSSCFSCGLPYDETRQHWFVDIHDGVTRKAAYLFCYRCVEVLQRQFHRPHPGCGHLPPPVVVRAEGAEEARTMMFCETCRGEIRGECGGGGGGGCAAAAAADVRSLWV